MSTATHKHAHTRTHRHRRNTQKCMFLNPVENLYLLKDRSQCYNKKNIYSGVLCGVHIYLRVRMYASKFVCVCIHDDGILGYCDLNFFEKSHGRYD